MLAVAALMPRDIEEVSSIFLSTLEGLDRFFSNLNLPEERIQEIEQDLYLWFVRYTKRPGNGELPIESLQRAIASCACRMASTMTNRDAEEVARHVGLPMERRGKGPEA